MLRPDGLDRLPARHVARGVLVGGALFLVTMLVAAAGAVAVGAILPSSAGRPVDLRPWLMLEVVGGTVASALSGWVCRKVSHAVSGPILLAGLVLTLGLLEAAEVTRYVGGRAGGPSPWLILGAPFLAAGGVLLEEQSGVSTLSIRVERHRGGGRLPDGVQQRRSWCALLQRRWPCSCCPGASRPPSSRSSRSLSTPTWWS